MSRKVSKPGPQKAPKKRRARQIQNEELPGAGFDRSSPRASVRELSWAEFDQWVQTLARSVQRTFRPDAVLGLAHGGVFVGGAVARALGCEFFPVRISRRSRDHGLRQAPKLYGDVPPQLRGRSVLVVDDVASSGDTLELAKARLRAVKAKQVQTASLIRRIGGFEPDFVGFEDDGLIVFPWDYETVAEDGRFDVEAAPMSVFAAKRKR
ncbi:MAG: phosphoribosyltransferase [Myxococcaceae bacterium]